MHAQQEHRTGYSNFCVTSSSAALLDLRHSQQGPQTHRGHWGQLAHVRGSELVAQT